MRSPDNFYVTRCLSGVQALEKKAAYMYCGHGSGSKYLSNDELEKLRVQAVSLLMGCKSGQLTRLGRSVDPLGTAHSYLLAASPAILGFLWEVTDLDVDAVTVKARVDYHLTSKGLCLYSP